MRMSEDVRRLNDLDDVPVSLPKARRKKNEDQKGLLAEVIAEHGKHLPKYRTEFLFMPGRKFRMDYAWVRQRLSVEIDGGQWLKFGGRHSRDSDRWKGAEAAAHGWRVIHLSPEMIKSDPLAVIEVISRALGL
jgi:very-short-patch-repair endonuclease